MSSELIPAHRTQSPKAWPHMRTVETIDEEKKKRVETIKGKFGFEMVYYNNHMCMSRENSRMSFPDATSTSGAAETKIFWSTALEPEKDLCLISQ